MMIPEDEGRMFLQIPHGVMMQKTNNKLVTVKDV
jgi:hypothetical protein